MPLSAKSRWTYGKGRKSPKPRRHQVTTTKPAYRELTGTYSKKRAVVGSGKGSSMHVRMHVCTFLPFVWVGANLSAIMHAHRLWFSLHAYIHAYTYICLSIYLSIYLHISTCVSVHTEYINSIFSCVKHTYTCIHVCI